ncbi:MULTISPECIES: DUF2336 domain-containing protein [Caulobacter]|jgi:uncharacterized protein (DUF2336 family)|uniref:Uncharacterized protein (DUF2336 family) n=1 Tax=Caulobacter rhizosphaerae TaxID=2010972 RepID=A0ABU1N6H6_9CAUL|nr:MULTISPECIES: DUF2336 domain-containing protein [Caulobacter]KQZ26089.1 hypothetical protein ASD47_23260 [Caulobacter sp. Root1472]MDR6534038.1 uncharacterized protein (DUF2336 family) [Caulobacter rhizosphaerae]
MNDFTAPFASPQLEPAAIPRSRAALLKRLADVVCLPASRINAFERAMTADLLVEMLRDAVVGEREKVARRLANLTEMPGVLVRLLLRDELPVARALLEHSPNLSDADLISCLYNSTQDHRRLIAQRRGVSEVVADALVDMDETPVIEALLRNELVRFSHQGLENIVASSRDNPQLIPLLLKRAELRPSHAYVMFWWSDAEARRTILQRFAVSREILQDAVGDVFPLASAEGWQDPLSRKALQFIERRQRNRAAIAKSPYDSLEDAIAAAQAGMTRETAEEISYLSGLKPMTGAKIFTDAGGEPLAILCKATGLPRGAVRALWRGLRRPETDASGAPTPGLERVLTAFDTIAVDRAQTMLRYWNWSLSSAMTPALLKAIREGDEAAVDEYSVPQRAAMLALSRDFGR